MDDARKRLARVPWRRRILTALSVVTPILVLLRNPLTAAGCLLVLSGIAAAEFHSLRVKALEPLARLVDQRDKGNGGATAADNEKVGVSPDSSLSLSSLFDSPLPLYLSSLALFLAEASDGASEPGINFLGAILGVPAGLVALRTFRFATSSAAASGSLGLLYALSVCGLEVLFLHLYVAPLAVGMSVLRKKSGLPIAASLVALSAAADSAGLFCGSAFGKRRLLVAVSPNKTVEGVVGSFFFGGLCGVCLWWLSFTFPDLGLLTMSVGEYLAAAMIASFFGLVGDLIESAFKRVANVKDSSSLLGPHGGLLDRLDSITLPIPPLFFFLRFRGAL